MSSLQAKFFYGLLRRFDAKRLINNAIEKQKINRQPFFSDREMKKYHILTTKINDNAVSTIGKNLPGLAHVIYFHGGMYVVEGNTAHKRWLINLFKQKKCKITYVDYPLAPENTYQETVEMVVESYRYLTRQFPDDIFFLMGDSAGGGLALILAQYLRDHGFEHRPRKLILYSPWVCLDMDNPEIHDFIHKDSILDLDLLRKSARAYGGKADLRDKLLSPYYGGCEDLGEMYVFYGEDELLAPDIKLLERKYNETGAKAHFYCYEGVGHDFQLFTFLPESKDVLRKTLAIIA